MRTMVQGMLNDKSSEKSRAFSQGFPFVNLDYTFFFIRNLDQHLVLKVS